MTVSSPRHMSGRSMRRRSVRRRYIVGAICLVILGVVVAAAIIGFTLYKSAMSAKDSLNDAKTQLAAVATAYTSGDSATAAAAYTAARQDVQNASDATSGSLWGFGQDLPGVGANFRAVQVLTQQTGSLLESAQPLIDALMQIDPHHFVVNGAFDYAAITSLADQVPALTSAVSSSIDALATVSTSDLIDQVREPYVSIQDSLTGMLPSLQTVSQIAPYVTDMLGGSGSRNYLMLFQNNAEVRSLGGNPASLLLLNVTDGKLTVAKQASSGDFSPKAAGITQLGSDVFTVFPKNVEQFEMDMTGYPDMPTVATLAKAWWAQKYSDTIDGVLTFDPVGLSYLLQATGPVTLPNGDVLTSDNVVKTVLSDVYARYTDPSMQDAYFAAAATSIFSALTSDSLDPSKLVSAFGQVIQDNRLRFWSANPDIQTLIAQNQNLSGIIGADTATTTKIGTYLWDTTSSKIDYYVTSSSSVTAAVCAATGTTTYTVDVTLNSTIGLDDALQLPNYVLGTTSKANEQFSTDIYVFGPQDSTFGGMTVINGGKAQGLTQAGATLDRPAARASTIMGFGGSTTLRFTFTANQANLNQSIDLLTTPMVTDVKTSTSVAASCG